LKQTTLIAVAVGLSVVAVFGVLIMYSMLEDYAYAVYLEKIERFSQIENEMIKTMNSYADSKTVDQFCYGKYEYTKDQWNCIKKYTNYGDGPPNLKLQLTELNNEYKQLAKEIGDIQGRVIEMPFRNGLFPGEI